MKPHPTNVPYSRTVETHRTDAPDAGILQSRTTQIHATVAHTFDTRS